MVNIMHIFKIKNIEMENLHFYLNYIIKIWRGFDTFFVKKLDVLVIVW